jgi:hypothetical protein
MGRFSGTNSRLRSPLSDCFSAPTLYVREGGNVFGDGVAQRQLALIDQQHRRDAGDGLGHRKKAKDGVWRDRQLGLHITDAEGLQIDWLPVLLNQDDRSRNFSGRDLVLEILVNALKLLRIEMRARWDVERAVG